MCDTLIGSGTLIGAILFAIIMVYMEALRPGWNEDCFWNNDLRPIVGMGAAMIGAIAGFIIGGTIGKILCGLL
ncbi:hypothetical protein FJY90_00100 [Candidatus Gottesmanbacteria bacterium]|nr:hypothetical protein [Candidatus Gottesmanbacteria bacterium]